MVVGSVGKVRRGVPVPVRTGSSRWLCSLKIREKGAMNLVLVLIVLLVLFGGGGFYLGGPAWGGGLGGLILLVLVVLLLTGRL